MSVALRTPAQRVNRRAMQITEIPGLISGLCRFADQKQEK